MTRPGILLVLAALLSSCAGPRPAPPATASVIAPAAWIGSLGPGAPMSPEWWAAFGDPQLTRFVAHALANNVDLSVAAARVSEARAQARLARAQLRPSLDLGAAALTERDLSPFGLGQFQTAAEPQLSAAYDLDLFGRLASASAAARAALLATEDARETVRLAVASSAATGYIALRAFDARLAIAKETLADRASALHFARRRAEAGYTSQLEMRQAEAEYRATEQLVPQAELAVTRQEDALRLLAGDVPGPVGRGAALPEMAVPAVPDGLPADLLRRRPDIAQAEQQLVAADRSLDSARAAFLPDVRLTGSAGALLSTLLPNPVTIWSLGGSILAPIFSGGRLSAQADVFAARRDQAAFAYRRAALTAFREVEDSLASVRRSGEQLSALQAQRQALAEAVRLATNRYKAGYAPYLDQLDAQRGLLNAELGVVQAENDRAASIVALYQAMGGGWQDASRSPPRP